ncbi:MAG: cobalamin B12-binding domain-containing protein, partial [Acidobacteria bacterium]|nr:cobalamin B12-binding domain-containing protein [Acidobacteriota bacterium]
MPEQNEPKKLLILLLPFWTPMIPPAGISSLKTFLREYGYEVKTADANIEKTPRALYFEYFERLRKHIPENRWSNFYSIGHHVLRNHMMAHLHRGAEKEYHELIKLLIENIYYVAADDQLIRDLDEIIAQFYTWEKEYVTGLLEKETPGVFGLSVYRDTLPASLFGFKLAKEWNPDIKTIMGGPIFSEQLIIDSPDMEVFLAQTEP